MKLHVRMMIGIMGMLILVIAFVSFVVSRQLDVTLNHQMRYAAEDMAKAIVNMRELPRLLSQGDPEGLIQAQMAQIQNSTRYQYIIVMDMEGIQYSYPYESGLYKVYKNGGEEGVLQEGRSYSSMDTNDIISAVRAFEPIYYQGNQVGAVLVGLLTDDVYRGSEEHREVMEWSLLLSGVIGIFGAVILAFNIKKSIFGLEPDEIALMLTERNLIIHSIERGIVAIDTRGKIILTNKKADELLGIPKEGKGTYMSDISYTIFKEMVSVLGHDHDQMNKEITLQDQRKFMISFCVMRNQDGEATGVVAGIESLTQVRALAEELTNSRLLVDSLRAQNHEFMNKLQTISGLLQLEEFEEALEFIDDLSKKNVRLHQMVTENIEDHKLGGLILSKYNQCMENKVDLMIDPATYVEAFPKGLASEDVVTIIGNLIDNSLEALLCQPRREIYLRILSNEQRFEVTLHNSGPEMEEETIEHIFEHGFSTKGDDRGYGLFLIKKIVDRLDGLLEVENLKGVQWHVQINGN